MRVRPAIPLVGGLVILTVLGALSIGQLAERRSARARDGMVEIAAKINDPEGLTTRSRGECPDQSYLIHCLDAAQDPDTLAAHYREALSRSAGRTADTRCETARMGRRPQSCLVRIDDGEHAVLVSIAGRGVDSPSGFAPSGSVVRIEAT